MKKILKNKTTTLEKCLIILLSLYFSFSITFTADKNISLLSFIIVFIVSFILLNILFPKILNFKLNNNSKTDKFNKKELILYGIIILIVYVFAFLALSPALANLDSISCWQQIHTNDYNNWHPIIYTLIFFKLPTIIYDNYVSCAIFQMCFIGIILLYFCYFLRKYILNKKGTIIILLLIILNPLFMNYSMFLIKDVPYSWSMLLATIFLMEIVITKGKWTDKTSHKVLLILASLGVMLFRHNGIVCILLMYLFLFILYKNKRLFYIIVCTALILTRFILYEPVYHSLNYGESGGKSEMLNLPLSQIAYIYHKGVKFTKKEQKLLDAYEPKEIWEEMYSPVSINKIKSYNSDKQYYKNWIDDNFSQFMGLYFKYAPKYPLEYLKAHLSLTCIIWQLETDYSSLAQVSYYGDNKIKKVVNEAYIKYLYIVFESPLKYILFNVGVGLFIIILALFVTIYKRRKSFEAYLPFVLVLSNTATIMLLIGGLETRYVYSQIVCALPLLVYAISLKRNKQ